MPKKDTNQSKKKLNNTKTKKQRRRGTKNKYEYWITEEGIALLEGWAREGLTDEEIAGKIGIARKTLYDWKKKYSNISSALKNGKEVVDFKVEQALLKRALGFKVTVRKPMKVRRDEHYDEIEYVDEELFYPPDTTAQIFWLKNRKRGTWTNSDKIEISADKETNELLRSITNQFVERSKSDYMNQIDTLEDGSK